MRITKRGNEKFGFEGKWHCDRCGCEWEMDNTDKKPALMSDQREGTAYHMPCPTCKHEVYRNVPMPEYNQR